MTFDSAVFLQFWRQRIERDLAPFADPGTLLDLTADRRTVTARWTQRGSDREARFTVSMETGVTAHSNGVEVPYRSFFAAADMADLMTLAKMTLQSRRQQLFVETRARTMNGDLTTNDGAATSLLRGALANPWGDDATLVVMVIGEAGAGKTRVLQELVRTQASDYLHGRTDHLFLYVNAQGRALARFNEALATELQDLRATLTYHAISTLVRLGLLVPVIDGFDELLGVGGYDDAFSSLSNFIEELDGRGKLIASARSTYYEQEFVARANRVSGLGSQVWKQTPVEVLAWGQGEFEQYIRMRAERAGLPPEEVALLTPHVRRAFQGHNEALSTKPLFVARTVDLVLRGVDLSGEGDLLDELVANYLERERTEKLLDRGGGALLTTGQLRALLVNLAEEMWNQETRELDRRSVREVAEFVLVTESIDEAAQRVVIDRMPDLAFLMPSDRPGSIAFEHETFFGFFLAHAFARALGGEGITPSALLSRSVLPAEVADTTSRLLFEQGHNRPAGAIVKTLGNAGAMHSARESDP